MTVTPSTQLTMRNRLFVLILIATGAQAQTPSLLPTRVSTPPVIDGFLDDEAWRGAASVSGFLTFAPDFGKPEPESTVVLMAYDAENLYFAFRCQDDPALIKTSISARDNVRSDDWICINLDTFGDQQGLTALYVNPHGIQMDSRFAGGNEDFSIDLVWYSAGRVTDRGYDVEVRLPLKSVRYPDADPVTMRVFFERYISRRTEHGSYPPMDPNKGYAFLTQMAPMEYRGLEHFTLLEVLPAVVYNEQRTRPFGVLNVKDVRREAGLTMKYGLTSDLILDGTLNPDFSQVEADAGQVDVNLRSLLFFPEKRSFFLEGREYFDAGSVQSSPLDPIRTFVHTRTILDPQAGLRLTGKAGEQNTVAALLTDDQLSAAPGQPSRALFGVVRYRRALSEDSWLGALGATRETGTGGPTGTGYNRLGGVDGLIRVGSGESFAFHAVGSVSRAGAGVSDISGHALGAKLEHSTRDLTLDGTVKDISSDFRADMGFITRTGVSIVTASATPHLYPASDFWNRIDVSLFSGHLRDHPSGLWETQNALSATAIVRGNLAALVELSYSTEVFSGRRFKTGGLYAQGGGQFYRWLGVTLIYRTGNAIYYPGAFQGNGRSGTAVITVQPTDQLRADYTFTYADFHERATDTTVYSYPINRFKLTYQVNKYLLLRGIGEYNGFRRRLSTDFLTAFTYIPGTVLYLGYGSLYNRTAWDAVSSSYVPASELLETNRGFFFKASYLWRM